MIEIKIPTEIRAYKAKLIFGFTTRQIVSLIGALTVCVPVGVLGYNHIPEDILMWLIILLAVPFIGYGFFTFLDMRFEEFVRVFLMMNLLPQKRVYEDTDSNLFLTIQSEILEDEIVNQRIKNGDYSEENESEWSELH